MAVMPRSIDRGVPYSPDTAVIKAALLSYFRFKRQAITCTEFDYRDVFVVYPKKSLVVEVEVKVSISDLKADFGKSHRQDLMAMERGETTRARKIVNGRKFNVFPINPVIIDQLFYAIPESLLEKARPIIEEQMPYAGIITIGECRKYKSGRIDCPSPYTVKRARKLKSTKPNKDIAGIMSNMAKRMSSEIANLHLRTSGVNSYR